MAKLTIVFGVLLIALGAVGYFASGQISKTAWIPSYFGAALAGLGALAVAKPNLRMHVMHAAVLVALLGLLGTIPGVVKLIKSLGGQALDRPAAVYAQSVMAALMLVYIVLCVRSFIAARKARKIG